MSALAGQDQELPQPPPPPRPTLQEVTAAEDRIEELSDSEWESQDSEAQDSDTMATPKITPSEYVRSVTIPIQDKLATGTTEVQDETLEAVLPFLQGNPNDFELNMFGLPTLRKEAHIKFLKHALGRYPSNFAAMDAARPWLLYWSLQGLTALGHDVSEYGERVVSTFAPFQHPTGGFGGGHGQLPHLACSYAATLSLIIVGTPSAYDSINRRTMWHYLGRMKQPDGGFTMCPGGEEDTRGAFIALVIISLLNLPLDLPPDAPARKTGLTTFLDHLGDWIGRCQTFEGGISAAPGNEAHGAYAFCALGCLSIMGAPASTFNKYLDMPRLLHWMTARQSAPEGGFHGRTNKLVDGCYSHWIGGCWPLVEAAGYTNIWNRNALARYILAAAQFKKGGLVDKPGKRPDAYHTCYNLAGLSAAQWRFAYDGGVEVEGEVGKGDLGAAFCWRVEGEWEDQRVWGEGDTVRVVHPVFVVPWGKAEEARRYFEEKEGF
ncbi:terpenoid cyclases/Protein prenyltransferase [Amniculicola lignicola CBS 123094]|uniref:Protein farnesyltransferase subunit beta n=1 Tax=Amniculicola lignicola CBS 123094 TaxID=1392246 RepID=A0A6A5WWG1_9PLEO|nr:terpenoid cyclases/Protein prenyltransferase [Amniculicola lignicola CBS 123094]